MEIELEEEDPTIIPRQPGFAATSRVVSSLSQATGLLIVDVSNLAYRSAYAYRELHTSTGRFSGHVYGAVRLLQATMKNHVEPGSWCVVFCYDGILSKKNRQAIMPAYKANRNPDRFNPLPEVESALRLIPGVHIKHDEREGDDAIAWAAEKMSTEKRKAVILSGDRDLWALLRLPNVRVFSPNLRRFVKTEDIRKDYLVDDPGRIPFSKALFGDSSDGIKGVERLLKKHVEPHLNEMKPNDIESFLELVENAPKEVTSLNTKIKVQDARLQIQNNLRVINPDISGFDKDTVLRVSGERDRLTDLLRSYQCNSLVERVDEFFGAEFYVEEPEENDM